MEVETEEGFQTWGVRELHGARTPMGLGDRRTFGPTLSSGGTTSLY